MSAVKHHIAGIINEVTIWQIISWQEVVLTNRENEKN